MSNNTSRSSTPACLLVFVKAPRPGQVKTRLARSIGDVPACAAYQQIVGTLLQRIAAIDGVELKFTPDDAQDAIVPWLREGWSASAQGGGDLGERLDCAFRAAFSSGAQHVCIIGSDTPEVAAEDIKTAWTALLSHDVALGPAEDGGYWLIGLRSPQPELFAGMPWSTPQVFSETLQRCQRAGLSVFQLRTLSDVDTVEDWQAWLARASVEPQPPM